jgi:hypothetical protein
MRVMLVRTNERVEQKQRRHGPSDEDDEQRQVHTEEQRSIEQNRLNRPYEYAQGKLTQFAPTASTSPTGAVCARCRMSSQKWQATW